MSTVADSFDVVIGVDTHADTHSFAVCSSAGGVLAEVTLPTSPDGLSEALTLADYAADPALVAFAVEGSCSSYGVGLTRVLQLASYEVIEVPPPDKKLRRGKGKSDPIDARRAVREALDYDMAKLPTPRACAGPRAALQVLLSARRDMNHERTVKINRLKALLRSGTPAEHALASHDVTTGWLNGIAARRGHRDETADQAARRGEARRLVTRLRDCERELKQNKKHLAEVVETIVPGLLDEIGIGPVSAAEAIVVYSHHGRCHSEGAYAKLAGAAPLEASSGKVKRHRLNRGGDRTFNKALHDIARARMRWCPGTKAYVAECRAAGKAKPEIQRKLKRYIARQLYRRLADTPALEPTAHYPAMAALTQPDRA